jgi:hypothetical protein
MGGDVAKNTIKHFIRSLQNTIDQANNYKWAMKSPHIILICVTLRRDDTNGMKLSVNAGGGGAGV